MITVLGFICVFSFRKIQDTAVGQTGWLFSPVHPWIRHACGNQGPWDKCSLSLFTLYISNMPDI